MANYTASHAKKDQTLLQARKRLAQAHRDAGSYRALARQLGVKHHAYIADFVRNGSRPTPAARDRSRRVS